MASAVLARPRVFEEGGETFGRPHSVAHGRIGELVIWGQADICIFFPRKGSEVVQDGEMTMRIAIHLFRARYNLIVVVPKRWL